MDCQKMDLIESLKVIFPPLKGQKRVKFGYFATFLYFFQKLSDNFLYFVHTASWG